MGCVSTLRLLLLELPFSKRIWKGDHAKPFDRPCWEANWQRSERQAACDHKHASYDGLYLTVTNIGAGKTTPQSPHLCFQLAWGASHFHSPLATRIPDPQEGDVDFTDVAHGARTIICVPGRVPLRMAPAVVEPRRSSDPTWYCPTKPHMRLHPARWTVTWVRRVVSY